MSRFTLLVLFLLVSIPSMAANWNLNKAHSEIIFTIPYLNIIEVSGRFSEFKGSAFIDSSEKISKLSIQIKAASISTDNSLRDGHLKAADFLHTAKYPEITFTSDSIVSLEQKSFSANGFLSLRGITKSQKINFQILPPVKDSWGYLNRFVKFNFQIKRKDYNLNWNKTIADNKYLIGEEISVRGTLQLQPENASTPSSKHLIPVTTFTTAKEKLDRGELSREEFEKKFLEKSKAEQPINLKDNQNIDIPQAPLTSVVEKDFRSSTTWWMAFGLLGLMGFFASIIIGFFIKTKIIEFSPQKYKEEGLIGNLSDIPVVALTLLYSMALWYVGWGQ